MSIAPQDWSVAAVGPTGSPAEVPAFCERLGLTDSAKTAVELVKKHFQPEAIRLSVGSDPEGDGEWLVIVADVRGSVADTLKAYDDCKTEWLAVAPRPQLGLVRFLYNIL